MALVPQESTMNSNKTLAPSVCFGLQFRSSRLVLSGFTIGHVEVGVATTVMVPSGEQTETKGRHQGSQDGTIPLQSDLNLTKSPSVVSE